MLLAPHPMCLSEQNFRHYQSRGTSATSVLLGKENLNYPLLKRLEVSCKFDTLSSNNKTRGWMNISIVLG